MIGATLKHLVSRTRKIPRMDSIEEDPESPLTPQKFEEGFLKSKDLSGVAALPLLLCSVVGAKLMNYDTTQFTACLKV